MAARDVQSGRQPEAAAEPVPSPRTMMIETAASADCRMSLPTHEERRFLHALLRDLARPRLAGSEGARLTDRVLLDQFRSLGYQVRERPFSFSAWPARYAVPLVGAAYLVMTLTAAGFLLRGRRSAGVATLLITPPLLGGLAGAASALVSSLPWGRIQTANWLASPRGGSPRYLIVAHRDSKSQPISTQLRTTAAATAILAWTTLLAAAVTSTRRPSSPRRLATRIAATIGALAGGTLLRCRVGNESPGALDNASGLAALIGIARRERGRGDVAFLVTDGEELWLAGAREAASRLPKNDAVINLDGLDDEGCFYLIDRFGWPPRSNAAQLAVAITDSAAELGYPIVRRDLPLGILVDHLPLARAGHPAVTIMRGSYRSLRRVHRPTDHVDQITGEGVLGTVQLVCSTLQRVRGVNP